MNGEIMIDVGINYITELENQINKYDDIYKFLIDNKFINTLKFPGKYCNYDSLEAFFNITKNENIKVDLHGLPNMIPAIHSENFIKNVSWKKIKEKIFETRSINRMSTHIGLENKDRLNNYEVYRLESNIRINMENLKEQMKKNLDCNIKIGAENIPGAFEFDIKTLTPDFISDSWQKVDFGVFDIAHAKLAAKQLNISYEDYIKEIKFKEKVKILHISGNIDEIKKYSQKPDKHVLIHRSEIKDIIKTIQIFNNIDLIISEYGYNTKYTYEKELIIESIILFTILKTMDEILVKKILDFLEQNLKNDVSNIQQIMNSKEMMTIK